MDEHAYCAGLLVIIERRYAQMYVRSLCDHRNAWMLGKRSQALEGQVSSHAEVDHGAVIA